MSLFCPLCGTNLAYGKTHTCKEGVGGLGELPYDYGRFISNPKPSMSNTGSFGDAQPWFYFGSAVVSTTGTSVFVQTDNLSSDSEGLLIGFQFFIESEDYQTSPVSLISAGVNSTGGATAVFSPMKAPPTRGPNQDMFFFPFPWGVMFKRDQICGLSVKNNESSSIYVEGRICGVSWPFGSRPLFIRNTYGTGAGK